VELFSADGKLVKELVVERGAANIILPTNGIYILKIGGQTTKIVAGN
jgi:activator of 2-hydroxyglutaryl-CoA dehydratase